MHIVKEINIMWGLIIGLFVINIIFSTLFVISYYKQRALNIATHSEFQIYGNLNHSRFENLISIVNLNIKDIENLHGNVTEHQKAINKRTKIIKEIIKNANIVHAFIREQEK